MVGDAFERFPSGNTTTARMQYGTTFRLAVRDHDGLPVVADSFLGLQRVSTLGAVLERNLTADEACKDRDAEAKQRGLEITDKRIQCGQACRDETNCTRYWPLDINYVGHQMVFFSEPDSAAEFAGLECLPQGGDDCQPMSELRYPHISDKGGILLQANELHAKLTTYRNRLRNENGIMEVVVKLRKAGLHTVRLRICDALCSHRQRSWRFDHELPWTVQIVGQCGPGMEPDDKQDCRCADIGPAARSAKPLHSCESRFACIMRPNEASKHTLRLPHERCLLPIGPPPALPPRHLWPRCLPGASLAFIAGRATMSALSVLPTQSKSI